MKFLLNALNKHERKKNVKIKAKAAFSLVGKNLQLNSCFPLPIVTHMTSSKVIITLAAFLLSQTFRYLSALYVPHTFQ
jgi:ABC-type Co2+ transport system permease subunit